MIPTQAINVRRDFGALGDGVTDDTVALQAAMLAAQTALSPGVGGGNTIELPPGAYVISDMLTVLGGRPGIAFTTVNLVGHGYNSTSIKWKPGTVPPPCMIRVMPDGSSGANEGALWSGFTLDGNGIASRGFWLSDQNMQTIERIAFAGFAAGIGDDACIYGDVGTIGSGCLLNEIRLCWFGRGGINHNLDIYFNRGNGNRIVSNEFGGTKRGSIRLLGGNSNWISLNDFEGLTEDGTYSIDVGSGHTHVVHNRFEDVTYGRPLCRSIYLRESIGGLSVLDNDFGHAGAGEYHIELAGYNSEVAFFGNNYGNQGTIANIKITGWNCEDIWSFMEKNASGGTAGHIEELASIAVQGVYGRGFKRLSINKPYPDHQPQSDFDVNGQIYSEGVATKVKAGVPLDSDFAYIRDGMTAVDETNGRFYVRVDGVWKYTVLT